VAIVRVKSYLVVVNRLALAHQPGRRALFKTIPDMMHATKVRFSQVSFENIVIFRASNRFSSPQAKIQPEVAHVIEHKTGKVSVTHVLVNDLLYTYMEVPPLFYLEDFGYITLGLSRLRPTFIKNRGVVWHRTKQTLDPISCINLPTLVSAKEYFKGEIYDTSYPDDEEYHCSILEIIQDQSKFMQNGDIFQVQESHSPSRQTVVQLTGKGTMEDIEAFY